MIRKEVKRSEGQVEGLVMIYVKPSSSGNYTHPPQCFSYSQIVKKKTHFCYAKFCTEFIYVASEVFTNKYDFPSFLSDYKHYLKSPGLEDQSSEFCKNHLNLFGIT